MRLKTLLLCALIASPLFSRDEPAPAPSYLEETLPVPPAQNQPWKPHPNLERAFANACEKLFEQGLADPRGCEYREITVGAGHSGIVKTHGWVLPQDKTRKAQYAITWSGVIYQLVEVGPPADLQADAQAMIRAANEPNAEYKRFLSFDFAPETVFIDYQTATPLKALLLLRNGEMDYAVLMLAAWRGKDNPAQELYFSIASYWTRLQDSRASDALERGDDKLALASLKPLAAALPKIDDECRRLGVEAPYFEDDYRHYIWVDKLAARLADSERRIRQAPYESIIRPEKRKPEALFSNLVDRKAHPDAAARIAALIRELENVSGVNISHPDTVDHPIDPVLAALYEEGEAAAGALLECFEKDERLTRSRDKIVTVADAALYVFAQVSAFSRTQLGRNMPHAEKVQRLREYHERYKGQTLPERWHAMFADPKSTRETWTLAMWKIVLPAHRTRGDGKWSQVLKEGEKPEFPGHSLRQKQNPSVTQIFLIRLGELTKSRDDSNKIKLLRAFKQWDHNAALATMAKEFQRTIERYAVESTGERPHHSACGHLIDLALTRSAAGDEDAAPQYANWLRQRPLEFFFEYRREHHYDIFLPLWRHLDNPDVRGTIEWMFNAPASPWSRLVAERPRRESENLFTLAYTPLAGTSGFRRALLRGLEDTRVVAQLSVTGDDHVNVESKLDWVYRPSGNTSEQLIMEPQPLPGQTEDLRMCDIYAQIISRMNGAPLMLLHWPQSQRNEAIRKSAEFLKRFGDRFAWDDRRSNWEKGDFALWRLYFPPLDHPATAGDLERGLAIFSLAGEGEVRQVKGIKFPQRALWATLKDYPFKEAHSHNGLQWTELGYRQHGAIWQAEEVFKDGRWDRYYGFAGSHRVARVPAGEIKFRPTDSHQAELTQGVNCEFGIRASGENLDYGTPALLNLGGPVGIRISFVNCLGTPRELPKELLRETDRGVELARGVSLKLWHSMDGRVRWDELNKAADAKDVPMKPVPTFEPGTRAVVEPLQEFGAVEFDLSDLFTPTEPGCYMLKIIFNEIETGITGGEAVARYGFVLK